MAEGGGRAAGIVAAAAGLALGGAAGWLAGRWSAPPIPPPPIFVNPLSDARKGENMVLRGSGGERSDYRVLEVTRDSVLLSVEDSPAEGPAVTRQLRASPNYFGLFLFLEGDISPEAAESTVSQALVLSMTPEDRFVPALGRSIPCWRIEMRHRYQGEVTLWVSNELPVHGLVRVESRQKGLLFEVESVGR